MSEKKKTVSAGQESGSKGGKESGDRGIGEACIYDARSLGAPKVLVLGVQIGRASCRERVLRLV